MPVARVGGSGGMDRPDVAIRMVLAPQALRTLSGGSLDFGGCIDRRLLVEGGETPLVLEERLIDKVFPAPLKNQV